MAGQRGTRRTPPARRRGPAHAQTEVSAQEVLAASRGQKCHKGNTLEQVADPDAVQVHIPAQCSRRGTQFGPDTRFTGWRARREFELPQVRAYAAEHRLRGAKCVCGKAGGRADAPSGVDAPAVYGPRLQAAGVFLYQGHFVPKGRIAKILADLCGIPIPAGSITDLPGEGCQPARYSTMTESRCLPPCAAARLAT
jgi:hypothetical protein